MKNKTLCDIHDFIIGYLEELKDHIDLEDDYGQVTINELTTLAYIAKEKGQSMEDRLALYREAIEDLGFKRVREEK